MATEKQTMGFQAEVKQLLQLMIHSLYSNKEIFLRELVSNASDAADKLRFEAINNGSLFEDDPELKIKISFDKAARTITISDNGIGMNRDEAISHLGTIAKSGTKEFFSRLSGDQQKDAALIGQFGVGFYSGFIIADRITVETRRAGTPASEGVRWESEGAGDFSIEQITKPGRGTDIILHLREGEDEFLSAWQLKSIIRKYSDHISLPILMNKEEWDEEKKETVQKDELETATRPAPCGPAASRRSRRSNMKSSTSTSRTTSARPWPTPTTAWKAAANIRSCSTSRRAPRSTCGTATSAAASSCTSSACSSWTMPSS